MNEISMMLYIKFCEVIQKSESVDDLNEMCDNLSTLRIMIEDQKEMLKRRG